MAAELPRPGVEVIEQFQSAAPTIVRPTLRPFVCGPAKEVIEVTTADGLVNAQAKQGSYDQLPKTITQSAFPSPRGNIAEVDVDEASIRAFFLNGGSLSELLRDPGEGFLTAWNKSSRATIRSKGIDASSVAIKGLLLVLAIDVPARLNTTQDVVVTFASDGDTLTPQQIVDQINSAVGETVASIKTIPSSALVRIEIASTLFGALSSVTVRQGGSANTVLGFDATHESRVEGSGFRGQDLNNNTTLTPWVEWFRGVYLVDGVDTTFPADGIAGNMTAGLIDQDSVYAASKATALTFTGAGSINLRVGDQFWADGVLPSSAQVMRVESARFKLGTINSRLSTYDSRGRVIVAVYDSANVNTLYAAVPFAPKYGWFKAENLTVNAAATAAYLLGTTQGAAAEPAYFEGQAILGDDGLNPISGGNKLSLAGLNLVFTLTIDGVEQDDITKVFAGGPFASVAEIVAALGAFTGMLAADAGANKIGFSTTRTGATQALKLKGTSTALTRLGFTAGTDVDATGTDVEFVDVPAQLRTSVYDLAELPGRTLIIKLSATADQLAPTWPTTRTHTFGAGPFADLDAVVDDIMADAAFTAIDGTTGLGIEVVALGTAPADYLIFRSTWSGSVTASSKGLKFDPTSTCKATLPVALDFDPLSGGIAEDVGEENLAGLTFKFRLNKRPKVYQVIFTSNSLVDAVEAINEAVGFPVAAAGGDLENQLKLTSTLLGVASIMEVLVDTWTTGTRPSTQKAAAALGFNVAGESSDGSPTAGTGRPNPDLRIDVSGSIVLGAEILRSALTGIPLNPGVCDTYVQYTGLRKDVSPSAVHPGMLTISDSGTLATVLNPVSTKNPLGLGFFFMMVNAAGLECCGLGVDETSAAEPDGTPLAYSKVCTFMEAQEVYGMAPLTHSETVAQILMTHVLFMSQPENKGERIVFINPSMPTRAVDDLVVSGTAGNTTATPDEFIGDANPISGLVARGIDPTQEIPVDDDLFVQLVINSPSGQEIRNYNVKSVNGMVWTFRTTFATGENTDGFYSTTPLAVALVNVGYKMAVRGAPLVIAGSTLPDKDKIAETVAAKCTAYKSRRVYYVFPDKAKATLGGTETIVEGYFMCAAAVGMVSAQPPQQGFTNLPMAGFTGVIGSNEYFNNRQLNVMAAGGCYIMVQDAPGGPITCRHQLSTNTTSIETRELSITKDVDFVAKFLRAGLRIFIGINNITQPFLDTLSTVIHGMNSFLEENGIVISADINNLIQSKDQPDTVLVDETLDVPYPCNYIRLTLAI